MPDAFPTVTGWWLLSLRRGFSSARQLFLIALIAGILITALGVPIVLVSSAVAAQQAGAGSQLNTLKVDVPATQTAGINAEVLDWMAQLPGVSGVVIDLSAAIYGDGDEAWDASVHVIRPWLLPPGITDHRLEADQVIVPDHIDGVAMAPYVGKTLPISYVRATGESTGEQQAGTVEVVGTYPAGWSGYGQKAVLAGQDLVVKLYAARYAQNPVEVLEQAGVSGAWVQAEDETQLDGIISAIQEKGFDVVAERDRLGALPGLLAVFPLFLTVVGVAMSLLLLNQIMHSIKVGLDWRAKEFGLLRMRGYRVADIRRLVTLEIISGVSLGALVGAAIGAAAGLWLTGALTPKELVVPTGWAAMPAVFVLLGLTVLSISALALVIGAVAVQRLLRQDPFLLVMGTAKRARRR